MTPPSLSSLLVDVELPDPDRLSPALVDLLASLRIVLVGWYAVPEQTTPAQARDQFGAQAQAALARVAQPFEAAGASVTSRLVFTGDELDTISRISAEEDCDAVLLPAPMPRLRRVLVPLRGVPNADRIAALVADLVQDGGPDVTLLHILETDETAAEAEAQVLGPAADHLAAHGIEGDHVRHEIVASDEPSDTIIEWAADHDIVVLGETEPSVREVLFGTVPERIVNALSVPVIVVRHADEAVEAPGRTAAPPSAD
jgi:nucleotide-binding universal stress UspA family protein